MSSPKKIDLVFPRSSTPRGGISDHSTTTACALIERGHDVRVLGMGTPGTERDDVPYVNVWPKGRLRDMSDLVSYLTARRPDLLVLQFEQFSYGHRGYNPELAGLLPLVKRRSPHTTTLLYAHEAYTSPGPPGKTAMWLYQRAQARRLARTADLVFHSSTRGMRLLGEQNPRSYLLPVHSNIAVRPESPQLTRRRLGIPADDILVLVFGFLDGTRLTYIRQAFDRLTEESVTPVSLVYVGKFGAAARGLAAPSRLTVVEDASPEDVSAIMQAADIALSPFADGVSTRRGSFAALMQHAVPTATTRGPDTDQYLLTAYAHGAFEMSDQNSESFAKSAVALVNAATREHMRHRMRRLFEYLQTPAATADAFEAALERRPLLERSS